MHTNTSEGLGPNNGQVKNRPYNYYEDSVEFYGKNADLLNYNPVDIALNPATLNIRKFKKDLTGVNNKNKIFQIDKYNPIYLKNKESCFKWHPNEHFSTLLDHSDSSLIKEFLVHHLKEDYPKYYQSLEQKINHASLYEFINFIPEDICILDKKTLVLKFAHLCSANQWSSSWGIGKNFKELHSRLSNFDHLIPRIERLFNTFKKGDYFERIGAVTLTTNKNLNRHPRREFSIKEGPFNVNFPKVFLRFERQVLTLIPGSNLILFSIRTYIKDLITHGEDSHKLLEKLYEQKNNPHSFIRNNYKNLHHYLNLKENAIAGKI